MKEKKKKEESTSSETPKKKHHGSERLSSMIESMQKRGSPVNAHKVATKYFDSFRKERNIPAGADRESPKEQSPTAVESVEYSAVNTAVASTADQKASEKKTSKKAEKRITGQNNLDETLSPSEAKIYRAILEFCTQKETDSYRFGLKMLKEITGLSDKTIRNSIHSLEDKMCIRVIEPSVGIYGRKIRVSSPKEVIEQRMKAGMEIDPTTKMVTKGGDVLKGHRNTGVTTAVSNTVDTIKSTAVDMPVSNAVITAVITGGEKRASNRKKVADIYEKYTGNTWGSKDGEFYKTISSLDLGVIETAIILTSLKGEGGIKSLSDIDEVLRELEDQIPEGYLIELRKVWEKVKYGT